MTDRTVIHIEGDQDGGGMSVDVHNAPSAILFAAANALMEMAVRALIADGLKSLVSMEKATNGTAPPPKPIIVPGRKN